MWRPAVTTAGYVARQGTSWMWATQVLLLLLATVFVVVRTQPAVAYAWLAASAAAHIAVFLRDRHLLRWRHTSGPTTSEIVRDTGHAFGVPALVVTGAVRVLALVLLIVWIAVATAADLVGGGLFLVVIAFIEAFLSALLVDGGRALVVVTHEHRLFLHVLWQVPETAVDVVGGGFATVVMSSLLSMPRTWVVSHGPQPSMVISPGSLPTRDDSHQIQLDADDALFV